MEDTNKANIVFNISGGNNQILPNAIKAEQNFYGDKYIEEMMKAKTKSQEVNHQYSVRWGKWKILSLLPFLKFI